MPEEWERELAELLQQTLRLHAELRETRDAGARTAIAMRLQFNDRRIDELCARPVPRHLRRAG